MQSINRSQLALILTLMCELLTLSASGQGTFPPLRDAFIAIEDATLIDGTGAAPAPGVTILIEENRIRQIGPSGQVRIPSGARRINGSGKYIIPGLIDAHVHYSAPFLHRLYLAHGVTTVRDVGTTVDKILTLREEVAAGNLLAPRLVVSGMGINPRSVKSGGFESARAMTEYLAERGVDGIKTTGYTVDELKAMVEVAHAHGLLVYGHTRIDPGALAAVEAGLDGIEHVTDLMEDCIDENPLFPSDFDWANREHFFKYYYGRLNRVVNLTKVDHLIERMVANEVYLDPTLINHYRGFVVRNTPGLDADPALRYMPEQYDRSNRYGIYGPEERAEWTKTLKLMQEVTRRFYRAGGFLIMGTDSQAAAPDGALPGWSMHQELELFVQAGLTPMEVIQVATFNNARVMARENELGTVEPGKYADLIILDADPLEEISNTRKIHLVIKDGLILEPEVLLAAHIRHFGERGRP
jgi:imidazolonepropionase-like amidohydrolase